MSTTLPAYSIITEGRVRRSRGSAERHTAQSQPSVGTPMEVPLPSTVNVAFTCQPRRSRACRFSSAAGSGGNSGLGRARQRISHFHVSHADFVKAILKEVLFGGTQIAFGLLRQQRQRIDRLTRANNVDPRLLALLVHQSKLQHGGHVERSHKA